MKWWQVSLLLLLAFASMFAAFQAASQVALAFTLIAVILFAYLQARSMFRAAKLRKFQTQNISPEQISQATLLAGDGSFSAQVVETKFHEGSLLSMRAKLDAPFFQPVEVEFLLVSRPLDRLRVNAVQTYFNELPVGWLELPEQSELVSVLDSLDGRARVKGKVTFGLKAESHLVQIDLAVPPKPVPAVRRGDVEQ